VRFKLHSALPAYPVFFTSGDAVAHASEQGIALLLPTDIYILTGCLAVIISIVVVSVFPAVFAKQIFKPIGFRLPLLGILFQNEKLKTATSILSLILIVLLVVIGAGGSRDPLTNLLPLSIWTFWWIAIVSIHVLVGNLWSWVNPWTGLYEVLFSNRSSTDVINLPGWVACWPATILYILFYLFIIADLAPDDPARLAIVVSAYVFFTFVGMTLFGRDAWLGRVECFTILCRFLSQLSPGKYCNKSKKCYFGILGWKAMSVHTNSISRSIFILSVLACGSFDGVNKTFWWLASIGINPLAFPGRSAVVYWSSGGLIAANLVLILLFIICIWVGVKLANTVAQQYESGSSTLQFKQVFCSVSISVLPIAAAYHGSHFLVSFLVNGQYLVAALSDPLAIGSNIFGLDNYQVTTGFLNTMHSVRRIWLTQASLIVVGHILAVLMAHHVITRLCHTRLQAVMLHIPLAGFMAAYTWFGLWLLAAPRGI